MQPSTTQAALAVDKAVAVLHTVIDDAASKAHEASNKAGTAGNKAVDWVSKRGDQLGATPKKLIADASGYVSANPLKSLGIAILAAFAVGRLLR
jgi:ElaB/YqjD/DUF883 family membrane-anchored ribosome-binding protein